MTENIFGWRPRMRGRGRIQMIADLGRAVMQLAAVSIEGDSLREGASPKQLSMLSGDDE